MKSRPPFSLALALGMAAAAWLGAATAQSSKESAQMHVHGTFDVKVEPQKPDNAPAQAAQLMRLSIDKRFQGALDAVSQGEMLASGDGKSGAYVALEKVAGALQSRKGSFVLMHRAIMIQGEPTDWSVAVVPDSGTEALKGLSGAMRITIVDGQHFYDFDYSLPKP